MKFTNQICGTNAIRSAAPASVWGMTPTMHGKTTNASIPKPRSADHTRKGGKKR